MTDADAPAPPRPPRTMSREARRSQLIEATIDTMAARGYARTTLTEVARTAGLSHGLVLFHFETKEKLLAETLLFLAEEYRLNWTEALDAAGPDPVDRLAALVAADFNPAICAPARLAAWCSFWGEAQSRPLYQQTCGAKDDDYNAVLESICAAICAQGGYPHAPVHLARLIRVTIEGVWLDMMTMETPYSWQEALQTVRICVALCFPEHFDAAGRRPQPQG